MIDETHSLVEYETKGRDRGEGTRRWRKGDDDILGMREKAAGATLI